MSIRLRKFDVQDHENTFFVLRALLSSAVMTSPAKPPLRVAFLHPDLGIGGAERLVVDCALALQHCPSRHYSVELYTSHHDPAHCFQETKGELRVTVYGDFLPLHLASRLHVVCAMLRNLYAAGRMVAAAGWGRLRQAMWGSGGGERSSWDVVIVDQLSVAIPLLRLLDAKILFYCHYPDLLLSPHTSPLKRLYRAPIDWLEETTTGQADCILVNSGFTASTFASTFTRLHARGIRPVVRYPAIDTKTRQDDSTSSSSSPALASPFPHLFLSINRFERKKQLGLAIRALAELGRRRPAGAGQGDVQLIVAGGYDPRVTENLEHYEELRRLCSELSLRCCDWPALDAQVVFLRSFTDAQKRLLLSACCAVVYTPENEHFGIVPIEGMFARRPVIATRSGGPCESIVDGETGFLCAPTAAAFATAMSALIERPKLVQSLGAAGRARVEAVFSLASFGVHLDAVIGAAVGESAAVARTDSNTPALQLRSHAPSGCSARTRRLLLVVVLAVAVAISSVCDLRWPAAIVLTLFAETIGLLVL